MEDYFLFVTYKGKTVKFKILNPSDSLNTLMEKLRKLKDTTGVPIFDLPNVDPSGAPINYYFGKVDDNGQQIILNPKVGKTELYLHDYNVQNGDKVIVIYEPIAG